MRAKPAYLVLDLEGLNTLLLSRLRLGRDFTLGAGMFWRHENVYYTQHSATLQASDSKVRMPGNLPLACRPGGKCSPLTGTSQSPLSCRIAGRTCCSGFTELVSLFTKEGAPPS